MKRTLLFLVMALATGTGSAAPPAPGACGPLLGCSDPRGCPNLRIDPRSLDSVFFQMADFSPTSCPVVEGVIAAGTRRLISFKSILSNLGPGDLAIGRPIDHLDMYEYGACHDHYHLRGYAAYRLWTPQGYGRWTQLRAANPDVCSGDLLAAHEPVAREMIAGRKQGFCVVDVEEICPSGQTYRYDHCDLNQGLSVGWSDIYYAFTIGQWIDITYLPAGTYVFEIEVNPDRLVTETNYLDNVAARVVQIPAP